MNSLEPYYTYFLMTEHFRSPLPNSISKIRNIKTGIPQGSVLGPLFFNILTHDILTTQTTSITKLQLANVLLTNYFKKKRINIKNNKCVAKTFTLRRINTPHTININCKTIHWKANIECVKYLGVYLDTRLT